MADGRSPRSLVLPPPTSSRCRDSKAEAMPRPSRPRWPWSPSAAKAYSRRRPSGLVCIRARSRSLSSSRSMAPTTCLGRGVQRPEPPVDTGTLHPTVGPLTLATCSCVEVALDKAGLLSAKRRSPDAPAVSYATNYRAWEPPGDQNDSVELGAQFALWFRQTREKLPARSPMPHTNGSRGCFGERP